ncbi:hypothetical protein Ancab_024425 [Ancistrocladus abbreviatus]
MDPEQTFIRVQERFSQMLAPRVRAVLEYVYLFVAITLFAILVVMHANYVQQPGCSSELSGVETSDAQLIFIKITSAGLLSRNEREPNLADVSDQHAISDTLRNPDVPEGGFSLAAKFWFSWISPGAGRGKLIFKVWRSENELFESQAESTTDGKTSKQVVVDGKVDEARDSFPMLAKESLKVVALHFFRKWYRRLSFIWFHTTRRLRSVWNIAGIHLNLDVPKWLRMLYLDRLNSFAVQWLERKIEAFEPTYLYTREKGYFLLPEEAKALHNIRTANITISARHSCFGNRWQQLLINRVVGYDYYSDEQFAELSRLRSRGGNLKALNKIYAKAASSNGYLYNYQTKEFYNLSFAHEPSKGFATFGDYLVTKCGVLMMSLFVFFTTTMSVSFTLRETQTRMLKFTVQLQHHARHRLPTFQLIFVHVIESLVFVPVPALQRYLQNRRAQQHPDFHITSSTILASTLHITRLNTRNPSALDPATGPGLRPGLDVPVPASGAALVPGLQEQLGNDNRQNPEAEGNPDVPEHDLQQPATAQNPGNMNSFGSLLLWILGGASSEGLNSFFSIFRDVRAQGQFYAESSPGQESQATDNGQ